MHGAASSRYLRVCCHDPLRIIQTAELGPPPTSAPDMDIFAGPLENGDAVVAFFNRGPVPLSTSIDLSQLGKFGSAAKVKDIWAGKVRPLATEGMLRSGQVAPHGVAFLRVESSRAEGTSK